MNEIMQGKVKTVFATDDPKRVLIRYEDKVTAGNGLMVDYPKDKGATCCLISALLFEKLEAAGIKTHYLELPSLNTMLCKKVEIIPVEVICRNYAAGSIVRETHLQEGMPIRPAIVEFYLKDDTKKDPILTPDRVKLMGIDTEPLINITNEINGQLQVLFNLIGLDLIDFKVEFGRDAYGDLYLADEISPDSMRLWKKGTKERFDKDLFRKDEGDIVTAYKDVLNKLRALA